jgi:hypothetical protein
MSINKRYSTDPEVRLPVSPARPFRRQVASGSYDPDTGRGNIFQDGGARSRQVPDAGQPLVGNNTKRPSRPGRW